MAPQSHRSRGCPLEARRGRYAVRPERLDAATEGLARVAAELEHRLGAIKRLAEASARERNTSEQREE
jgi:hypothetical protein